MKVNVDWDELYPYYFIHGEHCEVEIELTDEEITFIQQAHNNFWKAQRILEKKIHPNGIFSSQRYILEEINSGESL